MTTTTTPMMAGDRLADERQLVVLAHHHVDQVVLDAREDERHMHDEEHREDRHPDEVDRPGRSAIIRGATTKAMKEYMSICSASYGWKCSIRTPNPA